MSLTICKPLVLDGVAEYILNRSICYVVVLFRLLTIILTEHWKVKEIMFYQVAMSGFSPGSLWYRWTFLTLLANWGKDTQRCNQLLMLGNKDTLTHVFWWNVGFCRGSEVTSPHLQTTCWTETELSAFTIRKRTELDSKPGLHFSLFNVDHLSFLAS